jgi:hypothetical protein
MWRQDLAQSLQCRHALRLHGWIIGSITLLVTWGVSHLQMAAGVESLALRYLVSLGAGYLAYLCVVRLWAAWLLRRGDDPWDGGADLADMATSIDWPGGGGGPARMPLPSSGGGGDFAGAGASGDFAGAGDGLLGDVAGGAFEAAASADDGAVVVVPVVAIFLIGVALLFGVGALALLYFGWEVLLAVAVELAFSVSTARAFVGVEREGWLSAVVRLTWKPLLGAVVCAVLLGATIDHFMPQAQSLPEALHLLLK